MSEPSEDLLEKLTEEFAEAIRNGESPSIDDYARRYPDLAERLLRVLPALEIMEQCRPLSHDTAQAPPLPMMDDPPLGQVGDFHILREIGRGGMGIVYEAEQSSLRRRVALKVLPSQVIADARRIQRFENEVLAAAALHHSNIVPIYAVGQQDDMPYYAMQFIHGRGLDQVLAELRRLKTSDPVDRFDPLSSMAESSRAWPRGSTLVDSSPPSAAREPNESSGIASSGSPPITSDLDASSLSAEGLAYWHSVARIGRQVADALEHAHSKGVLHRDIKPSNLILDTYGNVWITDFGLAKSMEHDDLTRTGELIGTLRYLPPEQFEGKSDARSDIYSLGLTLYELITLEPAYSAASRTQLVEQVTKSEITSPRKRAAGVPKDLETIVLKSLAREPSKRYGSAAELAEDLRRFINDEPIRASREPIIDRLNRWRRRNPAVARSVAFVVIVVVVALAGLSMMLASVDRARNRAVVAEKLEREARENAEQSLYVTHMNLVQQSFNAANPMEARAYLDRYKPGARNAGLRAFEWYYWRHQARQLRRSIEETGSILSIAPTPAFDRLVAVGTEGSIGVWDVASGTLITRWDGHDGWIRQVVVSPDGTRIATGGEDAAIRIWELATGDLELTLPCDHRVRTLAFSPDGKRIAIGTTGSEIVVRHIGEAQPALELAGHQSDVYYVLFSPDGQQLYSASRDKTVRIWDLARSECIATLAGHDETVRCLALSPDGTQLASGSDDHTVRLWDLSEPSDVRVIDAHDDEIHAVVFSPDSTHLATASRDDWIKLWDLESARETLAIRGHIFTVYDLHYSPDGRTLVSSGHDKTVKLWDLSIQPAEVLHAHDVGARTVEFSSDEKHFISGGDDSTLCYWTIDGNEVRRVNTQQDGIWRARYDSAGTSVATAGVDGSVALWDAADGALINRWQAHSSDVLDLCFSTSGNRLATAGLDREVKIWNLESFELLYVLTDHSDRVYSVQYSPGGDTLATAGADEEIRLRNAATGEPFAALTGHVNRVYSLAFSPDGQWLASGGQDRLIRVWHVATRRLHCELRGHAISIHSLAWSPDGRTLASASTDMTIRLWDIVTAEAKTTLEGHELPIQELAFSNDGRILASAASDQTIRLWRGD